MKRIMISVLIVMALQSGCSFKPEYSRPDAPMPQSWPEGDAYRPQPAGTDVPSVPALEWESFFTDPRMQQVIRIALDENRDLKLALLKVGKTAALYGIQKAELFPSFNATAAMSSQWYPADLSPSGKATTQEQYSVTLGLSTWEIDFFGRIRNLSESALETYLATDEARRSTQILLIASTAAAYLNLAADRESLNLAKATLKTQQGVYQIVERRYQVGLATEVDLRQSQTQVDAARGDIARYTQKIALDINALNLLLGSPAPAEVLTVHLSDLPGLPIISAGLSSDVLLNRPDILSAEHQLKAANANIGAARAALFPRITLTASAGTAGALGGLFSSDSGTWTFAPKLVAPIFDARLWSAYDAARIESEIYLAQYEKTIQTAFREVADALAVDGTVGEQISAQASLVNATEIITSLSESRYQKGVSSYLNVLDAQRSLYSAKQALVSLQLARIANEVKLYAVLGGGNEPIQP